MILIITTGDDPHTDLVANELTAMEVPWVRLNTEDFPQDVQLEIELNSGLFRGAIHFRSMEVDIGKISSIWYRRPEPPQISPEVTDPEARQIAEAEAAAALRGLWAALYERFWMSWPVNIRRADQKLLQLRIATELGFMIPETLITQRPDQVRRFHEQKAGGMVVKTLSGVFFEGPPHRVIYTNMVKDEHLSALDYVGVCPTLFQQYIAKATELRITVVGNSVFAAEMYTQIDPRTTIDWRRGSPVAVPHRPVTLPPAVERCCLELVHRLGLTFGAIDMVRTPDGEFVFLEINPNGQWAWIEGLTGLQIAKKIAEVLSNPPEFVKNF